MAPASRIAKFCGGLGLVSGVSALLMAVVHALSSSDQASRWLWWFLAMLAGAIVLIGGAVLSIVSESQARWQAAAHKIFQVGTLFGGTHRREDTRGGGQLHRQQQV